MSPEAITAMKKNMLERNDHYAMGLDYNNFCTLIDVLLIAHNSDAIRTGGYIQIWIFDFLSSIAETLGIEFV